MENINKQINSFLSRLITTYRQQGQIVKVLIPALLLLVFCCLCSVLISLLPSLPFPTQTFFVPTAFPTLTASPTAGQTPTRSLPTATGTSIPSATASPIPTATNPPPTATATSVRTVEIIAVNKPAEYVEIQNFSPIPVDLLGGGGLSLRQAINPVICAEPWHRMRS